MIITFMISIKQKILFIILPNKCIGLTQVIYIFIYIFRYFILGLFKPFSYKNKVF